MFCCSPKYEKLPVLEVKTDGPMFRAPMATRGSPRALAISKFTPHIGLIPTRCFKIKPSVDGEDTIGHSAGCFIARRALRTPPLRRGGSGWNNLGVSQLSGWREEREAERCGGGTSAIAGVNMAETVRSLFDYRDPHSLDSDGEGVKPAPPLRG
ncbi:uncharacterized protein AKAME5_002451100 [Lates japonicus]|uniref:Uncharacterized protein n=1 Tax=Lates japonicus TaxID=270547 RepID=A0AAD3RLV3_LATJO|nr:uncharacterized protein AKAME5_002451100 [Lates japonicus]